MTKNPMQNREEFEQDYLTNTTIYCSKKYGISKTTISNWARKFGIPRKRSKWKDNEDIQFTQRQKEILNGCMLGDGCISKQHNQNRNCEFSESHQTSHVEILHGLYNELYPFMLDVKKVYRKKIIGYGDNNTIIHSKTEKEKAFAIRSMSHPLFTKLERKWYKRDENGEYIFKPVGNNGRMDRIKTIPRDLKLTPLTLAYWYFGDGTLAYKNTCGRICFYTNGFSEEDVQFLIKRLKNDTNLLNVNYYFPKINQPIIVLSSEDTFNFINMISEYKNLYKCFEYKFDLSNATKSWKASKNGPPNSPVDDEMFKQIITLIKENKSQTEIAKILRIQPSTIHKIVKGKSFFNKKDLCKGINYNNTSGIPNVFYNNKTKKWAVRMMVNGKLFYIGEYNLKSIAKIASKEARYLKENGITNKEEYIKIKNKYKN